jgi:predicted CxxxxCH...CXXCH cytochrome family protein
MKQYTWHFTFVLLVAGTALFLSCSENRTSTGYQVHSPGWNKPGSEDFHGNQGRATASESCAGCHGTDFSGGRSRVSCYTCHAGYPHPNISTGSAAAHAEVIAAADWNLRKCTECHGADFAGGSSGVSCLQCHTAQEGGPLACTTCHGNPPANNDGLLRGMPNGSFGAHAVHERYVCTECHLAVNALTHTGPLPAEVSFDQSLIAYRPPYPTSFTHLGDSTSGNGTCATYCHSDARGGQPLVAVNWVGSELTACQSCHAVPPASDEHPTERRCHLCHIDVDSTSNYAFADSIRFSDPSLHVNGVINIHFGP